MLGTLRSTPSFAVGGVQEDALCIVCGAELSGHHFLDVRGFCEAHCPDHDWDYDRYRRGHFCLQCDAEREYEPCDDDVGFGSGGYSIGDPIGIPASAMNGNAMQAGSDKWNRWVLFCEANGHP